MNRSVPSFGKCWKAGYMIIEVSNGREGLRLFRQTPSALVITDLLRPEQDGWEVTMALHRESRHIKIIVLTGGSGEGDFHDAARLLSAHRTIKKPVTMAELFQTMQQEL